MPGEPRLLEPYLFHTLRLHRPFACLSLIPVTCAISGKTRRVSSKYETTKQGRSCNCRVAPCFGGRYLSRCSHSGAPPGCLSHPRWATCFYVCLLHIYCKAGPAQCWLQHQMRTSSLVVWGRISEARNFGLVLSFRSLETPHSTELALKKNVASFPDSFETLQQQ